MPGLIVTVAGNATPFQKELARAEAVAFGFSKNVSRQMEAQSAASISRIKSQMDALSRFKMNVDSVRGSSMMSAEDSSAQSERLRQVEVEESARRNQARRLLRQRKADATSSAKEIAEAELAAQIETATRSNMARRLWRQRGEDRAARIAGVAGASAAQKAEELAAIALVARQGGIGSVSGAHGHKYGGQGGVISEVAVIGHELLQGRGTGRVLGSISILAQRLGLLGKLVKSTASEEIVAAFAENKLAGSMARTAMAAEKSGLAHAGLLRQVSLVQNANAAAATEKAEMAVAGGSVSMGPVGWILAGVVVASAAIIGLILHFRTLRREQAATGEQTGRFGTDFKNLAAEIDRTNSSLKEHSKWLKEIGKDYQTVAQLADAELEMLKERQKIEREQAESHGASGGALRAMDKKHLTEQFQFLENARNIAMGEEGTSKLNEQAAFDKNNSPEAQQARAELATKEKLASDAASRIDDVRKKIHQELPEFSGETSEDTLKDMKFKVGDVKISLAESTKEFTDLAERVRQLKKTTAGFEDAEADAKEKLKADSASRKSVEQKFGQVRDQLALFDQHPAILGGRGGGSTSVTERERIGLGAASGINVSLLDVARKHAQATAVTNQKLDQVIAELREGGF